MLSNVNLKIIKYRKYTYVMSLAILAAGLINIAVHKGLKMGIDFKGGNMVQVEIKDKDATIKDVRDVLIRSGYGNNVQKVEISGKNVYILKAESLEKENTKIINDIKDSLKKSFGASKVVIEKVDIVGPTISRYLLRTSYIIGIVAIDLILLYITFRFRFRFGITAIAALIHDVLVVLSFISFFGKEMDTYVLAAILTIIGYSLNDTIVIFDRARENFKSSKAFENYEETFNKSINQSLSRTIITSITTLIVVLSLYIFGGNTMRNFSFTIIIGILVGTYSSSFIASALVVDWHRWKPEKMKKV